MPMTFTRVLGRVLGGHLTDMGAVIEIDCEVLAWDYRTVTFPLWGVTNPE